MINYDDNTITQGERTEKIDAFRVWFRTPLGLCPTLVNAKEVCRKHEMPARFSIIPVPVAVGDGQLYEEVPR